MSVQHRFSVDLVKAAGAFMVVVLHVSASGFYQFDENWLAYNFYDSMVRVAVPLFLMVTGVLLLDRQQTLAEFFGRRATRILPPLVFWSLIYTLVREGERFDAASFFSRLFVGPAEYHLWYLYALLGIYASVPFLRVFYIHSSASERSFFLLVWALINCLWPTFVTLAGVQHDLIGTYALHSFLGFSAYLLLGATLGTVAIERFRFVGLIVFLASGLGIAMLTY
ncbi:acyltransferase, partial [Thauera propionica]|uniref:acyltransferase n=1 Tax=Thauera propionica TaxID=2019431 RepID=UPI0023F1BEB1